MKGRKTVKGYGDRTAIMRVKKGKHGGEIHGRTESIPVKGSRGRAHLRTLD